MEPTEQITEWAPEGENMIVVDHGASTVPGVVLMRRIKYLDWCREEAARLGGLVKKDNREYSFADGLVRKRPVVAVFA